LITTGADGGHSVVPTAKINWTGQYILKFKPTTKGRFACDKVPPGSYRISAKATGLTVTQIVVVTTATISAIALEMKIQAATESTTVTASAEPSVAKEPTLAKFTDP
jgi:hypothetical protein